MWEGAGEEGEGEGKGEGEGEGVGEGAGAEFVRSRCSFGRSVDSNRAHHHAAHCAHIEAIRAALPLDAPFAIILLEGRHAVAGRCRCPAPRVHRDSDMA